VTDQPKHSLSDTVHGVHHHNDDEDADVIIRPIDSTEATAVGELLVNAYVVGGHLSAESAYTRELSDVGSRLEYTWVAEVDGKIVGTICLCPPDGASPAALCRGNANEYEFRFLAISPDAWGGGVGQALVAECEAQAVTSGAERMVISVVDLNVRGLNFYALQGYSRMPERDWTPVVAPNPNPERPAETAPVLILALTKKLPVLHST
jgi:N-acetylglutamate synthase-like GNAT family acetyltransferase